MDKGQTTRYTGDEIALMKQFVKSREDACLILRNHFLQLELTDEEKAFLLGLSPEMKSLLKKVFLPELNRDLPLKMSASYYAGLGRELEQIPAEIGINLIRAVDIQLAYTKQQYKALLGEEDQTIVLESLLKELGTTQDEMRVINMMAFDKIVMLTEGRVNVLLDLTRETVETPEEQAKRLQANSSK